MFGDLEAWTGEKMIDCIFAKRCGIVSEVFAEALRDRLIGRLMPRALRTARTAGSGDRS